MRPIRETKRKKFPKEQTIKSVFLGIFLVLLTITTTGILQFLNRSYAAMPPVESLPQILYSKTEDAPIAAGVMAPLRSEYIEGISIIKRFYAVDDLGKDYDIYCLDRWLVQISGKKYTKKDQAIEDKGMAYLLSQIYPNNDQFLSGQSDDVKRYISQLLIWYYQDRSSGYKDDEDICSIEEYANNQCKKPNPETGEDELTSYWSNSLLANEKERIKNSQYWPSMEQILTEAANYQEDTNYGISIDKDAVKFTLTEDEQFMESNYISLNITGSNFLNYVLTTNNQQVSFYDKNGNLLQKGTAITEGTSFKIRVPIAVVRNAGRLSLHVKIQGTFSSKDAYYYLPPDKETQRALVGVMQLKPLNKEVDLEIDDPMGSVKISKQDATTSKELSGATLILRDASGKEVERFVSTNTPHYIDPIKAGTYTLTEIIAPQGYALSKKTVQFTVEAGKTTPVVMENVMLGKASIRKTDMVTGKEVEGATLIVRDSKGKEITRWISGKDAHIIDALEDGEYTLTESIAPDGYAKNETSVSFTIEAGKTTPVVMENEPYGTVQILKVDTITKKPLKNATLAVFDVSGKQVEKWKTTTEPHTLSLLKGVYTLKEIEAPDGYKINLEEIPIQVQPGKTVEVEMENIELGKASIRKTDMVTGEEVEGATLIVQDSKGKEITRWISGKDAHIIDALEDGEYMLTESIAPDGYAKNETSVSFTIEAGKTTPVVMENEPYGRVQILKIDLETRKLIEGATLSIKDESGNEVSRWTSKTSPYEILLPKGKYTLLENNAPDGYVGNSQLIEFEVEAGKLVQLEVENVKKIEVPNTNVNPKTPIFLYITVLIVLILGIFAIYTSLRPTKDIK